MKGIYKSLLKGLLALVLLLPLSQCKEIGPGITLVDIKPLRDTTYIDTDLPNRQHRKVLFEEFTGVTCNNCPLGHQTARDIEAAHPDSVILVAIHNDNPLANPFPGEDTFRTAEGIMISQKVGASSAIPAAAVDRRQFTGQSQIAVYRPFWADYVKQALPPPVPVNVGVTTSYSDASREVTISIKLHFLQDVDSTTNLSIYLIENDIISPQLLKDLSVDSNYVHKHILRGMVTPAFGIATAPTTEEGRVVEKDIVYTLPNDWNADNCEVVAFVHYAAGSDRVLQANSAHVK